MTPLRIHRRRVIRPLRTFIRDLLVIFAHIPFGTPHLVLPPDIMLLEVSTDPNGVKKHSLPMAWTRKPSNDDRNILRFGEFQVAHATLTDSKRKTSS